MALVGPEFRPTPSPDQAAAVAQFVPEERGRTPYPSPGQGSGPRSGPGSNPLERDVRVRVRGTDGMGSGGGGVQRVALIPAHRCLLAARSEFFSALFSGRWGGGSGASAATVQTQLSSAGGGSGAQPPSGASSARALGPRTLPLVPLLQYSPEAAYLLVQYLYSGSLASPSFTLDPLLDPTPPPSLPGGESAAAASSCSGSLSGPGSGPERDPERYLGTGRGRGFPAGGAGAGGDGCAEASCSEASCLEVRCLLQLAQASGPLLLEGMERDCQVALAGAISGLPPVCALAAYGDAVTAGLPAASEAAAQRVLQYYGTCPTL